MRARRIRYLVAAIAAATSSHVAADAPAVKFAGQIQPLFNARCVACHQFGAEQARLSLEDGAAYANLVGVKSTESKLLRVAPGSPEQSYLLHKLRGTQASVGGTGVRMPFAENGVSPLSAAEESMIRTWVEQGAPNN